MPWRARIAPTRNLRYTIDCCANWRPVPIGFRPMPIGAGSGSGEYVQVLDKYLSRLASLKRPLDALRVYRTEIDRNPNDPGLYERLADFLEQNGMAREVEEVYTQAIAKFPIAPGITNWRAGICAKEYSAWKRSAARCHRRILRHGTRKLTSPISFRRSTRMPRSTAS
jgi:tetratricopeptide (TPR) repeat protein